MEIPKRMRERLKEIVSRSDAGFTRRSLKTRPFARENCQCCQASLRMICWPRTTDVPRFCGQNQSFQIVAMGPPTVPQLPQIFARRFVVDVEIGRLQETRGAEQQRLAILNTFPEQP